jgi:hypothetical protein
VVSQYIMSVHRSGSNMASSSAAPVEEEMEKILRSAGIESSLMDVPSMNALKDMIVSRQQQQTMGDVFDKKPPPPAAAAAAVAPAMTATSSSYGIMKKVPPPSSMTRHWDTAGSATAAAAVDPIPSTPYSSAKPPGMDTNDPMSVLLMEQLNFQTRILLDLQKKIQVLTDKVDLLERAGVGGGDGVTAGDWNRRIHSLPSPSSTQSSPTTKIFSYIKSVPSGESDLSSPQHQYQQHQQQQERGMTFPSQQQNKDQQHQYHPTAASTQGEGGVVAAAAAPVGTGGVPVPTAAQPIPINNNYNNNNNDGNPVIPVVVPPIQQHEPLSNTLIVLRRIAYGPLYPFVLVYRLLKFELDVWRTLWRMGGNEIPRLEGGMVYQLIFIVLVLSSRISPNTEPHKFAMTVSLIFIGFLYQTKALPFLYRFFVRDNIPLRIWNGRDPDGNDDGNNDNNDDDVVGGPPQPGQGRIQPGNNNGVNNGNAQLQPPRPRGGGGVVGRIGDLGAGGGNDIGNGNGQQHQQQIRRNTFFTGGIAPHRQEQNAGGGGGGFGIIHSIISIGWDIIYLFGSFFFSIFPMWRPEAQQLQPQYDGNDAPVVVGGGGNEVDVAHNLRQGGQLRQHGVEDDGNAGQHQQAQLQQIPEVRPPRDVMEPADDDDDDDDEDDIYA